MSGESPLPGQDTTQILNRLFTGRVVGQPAMGYTPIAATVVSGENSPTQVVVTVVGFDSQATCTCHYEPKFHWNGSTNVASSPPPKGTACVICFPPNDPNGYGWAIAFTGWPTE